MQNTKEFFSTTFKSEAPKFVNVINALPADKLSWKPDEKSRTAIELASVMAAELGNVVTMLQSGAFTYDPMNDKVFSTPADAAGAFQKAAEEIQNRVAAMSDAEWEQNDAAMMMDGKAMWTDTRGGMAWGFMFDLIHHRGQLSTYIRPMGGKVPSIYGPSADNVS